MRTGIFVGSFNPFTVGHDSIVTRALPLFDRLVIGVVGDQVHKPDMPSAEERIKAIADLYKNEPAIEVKPYYGLAVDFARAENAQFIVHSYENRNICRKFQSFYGGSRFYRDQSVAAVRPLGHWCGGRSSA